MEKISTMGKIVNIPLENLSFSFAQTRTINVGKDIKELAESIKKVGLLEPIVVCKTKAKDKYEIIAGQRRFLAHKELKLKSIQAVVINRELDEAEAKALSLTENWHRLELSRNDERTACLVLWRRYKSIDMIVEETRLPANKIRQYLKFESLIKPLKKMVDEGQIDLDSAIRAQAAASVTGAVNEKEAMELAKEMEGMSGAQRKKIVKDRKEDPEGNIEEIIEKAKSGEKITQIVVSLGPGAHKALQKFAKVEHINQDLAASNLIEEGLSTKGFLDEE